ncbi:MAG TPA: CapA family protein [Bacteroidota bacterium]|nr:CapA family protein [Bacteroidota bacterium]
MEGVQGHLPRRLGVAALALLASLALWVLLPRRHAPVGEAPRIPAREEIRVLALGDINLGRRLGQRILRGDTLYPFARVTDTLRSFDVVFANLESTISDQRGLTEDPHNNMVFTAPPAAARALRRAGVTVVSTANNHALDFGPGAVRETIRYLDSAGIAHAGTPEPGGGLYAPARLRVRGFRISVFAVTDLMNGRRMWTNLVAPADTGRLLPAIRAERESTDVVLVSFHGGVEYSPGPSARTRAFAEDVLAGGADVVLGHHPHVPYGMTLEGGKLAVHSLGNFVFMQPRRYWTRFSYALALDIVRDAWGTRLRAVDVLPLRSGFQPEFIAAGADADAVRKRVRLFSSLGVREQLTW